MQAVPQASQVFIIFNIIFSMFSYITSNVTRDTFIKKFKIYFKDTRYYLKFIDHYDNQKIFDMKLFYILAKDFYKNV